MSMNHWGEWKDSILEFLMKGPQHEYVVLRGKHQKSEHCRTIVENSVLLHRGIPDSHIQIQRVAFQCNTIIELSMEEIDADSAKITLSRLYSTIPSLYQVIELRCE